MLQIKTIKKENGELGISFVIQTAGIKQKYSDVVFVFCDTKERIEQRLRLFRVALQVLRANPEAISLEKIGKENQLSFSWEDKPQRKVNTFHYKNLIKKKIVKVATGVSAVALIVCASAFLIPFINADVDGLCVNDVDVVLVMDTTGSMADGSKCEWIEERDVIGQNFSKWYLNITNDMSEQWCVDVQAEDNYDETSFYYGPPIDPTYTPSKIVLAKDAAIFFVGKLGENDQSALVSFNTLVSLNPPLSSAHSATQSAIDGLTVGAANPTDIAGAIGAANNELSANGNPQAIKAMILLTDGQDTNTIAVETARDQAAALGYKIFTIGLGSNADPALPGIAAATHGQYHYAEDGSKLDTIYNGIIDEVNGIAQEICQYGSISGCKYSDANNNRIIDNGEEKLSGWQIVLTGVTADEQPVNLSQSTSELIDKQGCFKFAGLVAGNYTVSETPQTDWQQTYPNEDTEGTVEMVEGSWSWQVTLNEVNNKVDGIIEKHFANYFPCDDNDVCTDDSYDPGTGECVFTPNSVDCDDGNACTFDDTCLDGSCFGTPIVCDDENLCTTDVCIDGECVYTPIDCDDEDLCTTDVCIDGECVYTLIVCDDGIVCTKDSCINGSCQHDTSACTCNVDADCDDSNLCTDNTCNLETYTCEITSNTNECNDGDACTIDDICSDGACSGILMVCDDGIECTVDSCVEGECQYDDSNCHTDPEPTPPSGGGAVMIPHSILDVRPIDIVGDSVTITWRTSFFATSQVIYSIEGETHEFDADNPPLYGYAHMTPEQDTNPKVTFHTVVISGLSPGQTYYYITISRASPAVFSNEFRFTILASLEEDDASETDETQEQESAITEDSSDEPVFDESAASEKLSLEEVEEKLNEISNKVATIGQEVAKISPRVNVPSFASTDLSTESLASNDLDSEAGDEEPLFADATTDEASFAESTADEVNNEINDEPDDSKFLAGIGTFFSNLEGWRLALIFLLGIILALIILRLIRTRIDRKK